MKVYTPDYYNQFQCIASACKRSCCVGWEIMLDDETYKKYKQDEWLNKHIAKTEDGFCIVQDDAGRCPFLNKDNLCDIILKYGEQAIGQICTDHPRFRFDFETHTEMGLGLCCEEACRLILQNKEKVQFAMPDLENLSEREQAFYKLRAILFEIAQNRDLNTEEKFLNLQKRCGGYLPELQPAQWINVFSALEQMDKGWMFCLSSLNAEKNKEIRPIKAEQLLVYFLYRHLPEGLYDGRFQERILFCVLSAKIICDIAERCVTYSLEEIASLYSAEIEYSEENTQNLLDFLEESIVLAENS